VPTSVIGEQSELWGYVLKRKVGATARWRAHLQQRHCAGKVIYWSGVNDPYATPAAETKGVWSSLLDVPEDLRPERMIVQTRFTPDRDAQLIEQYAATTSCTDGGPPVVISFSLGTDRNDIIRAWERATPSFERRMKTIHTLCEHRLYVVATLSPFALWKDLGGTLRSLDAAGVAYVTILFFKENTHGARTPAPFLNFLHATHPELLDRNGRPNGFPHRAGAIVGKGVGGQPVIVPNSLGEVRQPHFLALTLTAVVGG